jgi:hypothetical protein
MPAEQISTKTGATPDYLFPKPGADKTPVTKEALQPRSVIWSVASDTTNRKIY